VRERDSSPRAGRQRGEAELIASGVETGHSKCCGLVKEGGSFLDFLGVGRGCYWGGVDGGSWW
jgi:hypothetical protein